LGIPKIIKNLKVNYIFNPSATLRLRVECSISPARFTLNILRLAIEIHKKKYKTLIFEKSFKENTCNKGKIIG